MEPFAPPIKPFRMKNAIEILYGSIGHASRRSECLCLCMTAFEARPVPGGERRRLVKEEELGPVPRAH